MRHLSLIILTLFISCSDNSSELNGLRKENDRLRSQLDSLYEIEARQVFWPVVVDNMKRVPIGQEYIAEIRLSSVDVDNPPVVIVKSDGEFKDTLMFDPNYYSSKYVVTPTKPGKQEWFAKILYDDNGRQKEFEFQGTFEAVKEN